MGRHRNLPEGLSSGRSKEVTAFWGFAVSVRRLEVDISFKARRRPHTVALALVQLMVRRYYVVHVASQPACRLF